MKLRLPFSLSLSRHIAYILWTVWHCNETSFSPLASTEVRFNTDKTVSVQHGCPINTTLHFTPNCFWNDWIFTVSNLINNLKNSKFHPLIKKQIIFELPPYCSRAIHSSCSPLMLPDRSLSITTAFPSCMFSSYISHKLEVINWRSHFI